MRISHVNVTIDKGGEERARAFYGGALGLREIPKPEAIRGRGGVWFDVGGVDLHLSVEEGRSGVDGYRHFGIEVGDVNAVRARVVAAGVEVDAGRPAPWKRFFCHDPFGNRVEAHEVGGLRG